MCHSSVALTDNLTCLEGFNVPKAMLGGRETPEQEDLAFTA